MELNESRQTAVLFADVSGSTRLYEALGDTVAMQAVGECLEQCRQCTVAEGGRVIKTIGDEVMAFFPTASAAASAAAAMQNAVALLPPVDGVAKRSLRVGFHCGPVLHRDDDVYGDTVNLAARLAELATRDQIITSAETATQLSPVFRGLVRRLYSITVKGRNAEVELVELIWRQGDDMTMVSPLPPLAESHAVLRLLLGGQEYVRRRERDAIVLGRDQNCGLPVPDSMASRQHCTIELQQGKYILSDHSTNGTYVTVEGDEELVLRRESLTLRRHGWIALGQPRDKASHVVEYFCE